ncbi:DNRLRE domain-containing protein [Granulicella arctica]|uniref:DNRLRE domain-containing protein n=1 Tax=Granulicella arctica TaxID=940613 RepID=UPI0021DFF30B|nr:DNRLRE domain-containing protein [Granulicella arctica]
MRLQVRRSCRIGGLWLAFTGAILGVPLRAQQATLVADAHVNSALPAVNSGAISNLNVGNGYTTLLQFDLGLLPSGTTATQVTRAILLLYCNRINTAGPVSLSAVNAAWGEYSVTWQTLPTLAASAQTVSVSQAGAYVAIDVTAQVKGWITTPTSNNGVALTATTADLQFDSKENDQTAHAPVLQIALASSGATGATGLTGLTGPAGAAGPAGANGTTGSSGAAGVQGLKGDAGSAGSTGPAGLTGPAGSAGASGPVGSAGLVGPAGAPGLVYQGTYTSTTNYTLGDVVLWQGASYASLAAANHGNTPSLVTSAWGVLTAVGPAGIAGPQGVVGSTGSQGLPGFVGPAGPLGTQGVAGPQGPSGAQGLTGPAGSTGDHGAQGLQGIAGQAGAQGIPGSTGAQGLSGPIGLQGIAGPVGMSFQGAYSSITNYGLGEGVLYGGAGYVSLTASNHGNTPDLSPAQWAEFASGGAGPAGPTGPIGITGASGASGLNGATGIAGPQGAIGPQGPAVANYTGAYLSATNYALHDAVSYNGSTYVSLTATNHGNTPDQSPQQWAVLAAQGIAGPIGSAGIAGPAGAAGTSGVAGAAGPQGPPVQFSGGWIISTTYTIGQAISYAGSSYIALTANTGRQPDLSPQYWGLLAQAGVGSAGATGPTGPQGSLGFPGPIGVTGTSGPQGIQGLVGALGPSGATGPAGSAGPTGATGIAGLAYRGTYVSNTNYGLNDAVTFQGASYISLTTTNVGQTPGLSANWSLLAAQGAAGAVGARFRGPWGSGVPYALSDAVSFAGSTYLAQAANSALEPDTNPAIWSVMASIGATGPTGPSGPSGQAATITVGSVATGLAGSPASVTNSGSSAAAVLNFIIPQGAAGSSGGGSSGSGISAASVYHPISNSFLFYSVTTANSGITDTAPVLTWVPNGCTATSLMVYSEQGNQITVRLRQGSPTALNDTALTCTASANIPCTATGSVPVPPGSFIDLSVLGANGTASPVWTALVCN